MPDDGDGRPALGDGMPDDGDGIPPLGDGIPDDGDGIPPLGDGIPPDGDGIPPLGDGIPDDGEGIPPLGDGIPPCGPDIDCWLAHAARPAALPATRISWISLLRIAHLGRYREAKQPSLVTLCLPEVQPMHGLDGTRRNIRTSVASRGRTARTARGVDFNPPHSAGCRLSRSSDGKQQGTS